MGSCYNQVGLLNYFEENTLITLITGFTFMVIFIFVYILKAYTFFDKRRIPRAVHPTAPFGNIKDVLFQEITLYSYLWKYYNKFKRKGFKYGGLYLFFKPSVLIVDSEVMQKISSEPTSINDGDRKHFLKDSTVMDLFTEDNLENFLLNYNAIKNTLLMNLNENCISTSLHNFFMKTTSLLFGFNLSLEVYSTVNSLLDKKRDSSFKYYFDLVYPLFKRNNKHNQKIQVLIKDIVDYRKKNDIREMDLMQSFIDLYNKSDFNLSEMILEIFDVFVDNVMYSSSSLMFCLYELASNKDIQHNLIEEIGRFNKENKSIDLKNLQQLSYLEAVVKETLRKYPAVPVIIKQCKEYYKIHGTDLELPKGIFILYSVMGVHYDPLNYLEPEKFNPNRFLDEFNGTDISNVYIPFGFDTRKEIGLRSTVLHIKLGLMRIMSSYSVSMSSKYTLEFDNKKLLVFPKEPLPIVFKSLLK